MFAFVLKCAWTKQRSFLGRSTLCLSLRRFPTTARLQFRPKPKSSGLEVKANLDFRDEDIYSQCSNINKQGIYLQVNYRGLV